MDFNQNFRLERKQILIPALQQSLRILSMNTQQLDEFIEQQQLENPVIERQDSIVNGENDISRTLFDSDIYHSRRKTGTGISGLTYNDFPDVPPETLEHYLEDQLEIPKLSKRENRLALHIIRLLDERGYLCVSTKEICDSTGVGIEEVEFCLKIVQSMEPSGVGARNIAECLEIQLLRSDLGQPDILQVVHYHLEDVARGHLSLIAKKLHIPLSRVRQIVAVIRTLNPYPGSCFTNKDTPYIIPDVIVNNTEAGFEIALNDRWITMPVINKEYAGLLESCENPELESYLNEKIQQAKYIMHSIEQRKKTIFSVMEVIVHEQQDFFRGSGSLLPLGMRAVASALGVHESTVCRVVKGKYVQCDRGTFPMRYFFIKALSGNTGDFSTTNLSIKDAISRIIQGEDKISPLSDADISKRLENMNISISRRTVAKYRDEMGIKNTCLRKNS